jgi:hypothetical protein
MPISTKCPENKKKMTTNVIEHDDRLWYLQWSIFHCVKAWFWRPVFFARDSTTLLLQTSKTDYNALDIDAIYNLKLRKT